MEVMITSQMLTKVSNDGGKGAIDKDSNNITNVINLNMPLLPPCKRSLRCFRRIFAYSDFSKTDDYQSQPDLT